jgi:quinol monooxygenase YgiN
MCNRTSQPSIQESLTMITVTAIQLAKADQKPRLEALVKDLLVQVRQEPGCATFDYVRSRDNPNSYLVIEQYVDQQALTFHQGTDYLKSFIPNMLECLEGPPTVVIYEDVFADLPD